MMYSLEEYVFGVLVTLLITMICVLCVNLHYGNKQSDDCNAQGKIVKEQPGIYRYICIDPYKNDLSVEVK